MNDCIDKAHSYLVSQGYKKYNIPPTDSDHVLGFYQKDVSNIHALPLCNLNDSLSVNVRICRYDLYDYTDYKMVKFDVSIVAEDHNEDWYDLQCYNVSINEIQNKLVNIENKLICAWSALNLLID